MLQAILSVLLLVRCVICYVWCVMCIYSHPVVWSWAGPVPAVCVLSFCLLQSMLSVVLWVHWQKSVSKAQFRFCATAADDISTCTLISTLVFEKMTIFGNSFFKMASFGDCLTVKWQFSGGSGENYTWPASKPLEVKTLSPSNKTHFNSRKFFSFSRFLKSRAII